MKVGGGAPASGDNQRRVFKHALEFTVKLFGNSNRRSHRLSCHRVCQAPSFSFNPSKHINRVFRAGISPSSTAIWRPPRLAGRGLVGARTCAKACGVPPTQWRWAARAILHFRHFLRNRPFSPFRLRMSLCMMFSTPETDFDVPTMAAQLG